MKPLQLPDVARQESSSLNISLDLQKPVLIFVTARVCAVSVDCYKNTQLSTILASCLSTLLAYITNLCCTGNIYSTVKLALI